MNAAVAQLLDIHRHSAWANRQLLNAADPLSPEQLRTPVGEGSIGDLFETLIHMYDAQQTWFNRICTGTSGPTLGPQDFADIAALRVAWEGLDVEMDAWLAGLDDATLTQPVSYRSFYGSEGTYSPRDLLLHQAFHSHQHRGEVALVLSKLGHSPGELDFIDYVLVRDA